MSLIDLASMVLAPTAVKDGKVYNAIPNDQDFTFSRGTEATRINSAGLIEKARTNFLLQSNTFDTTWTTDNTSVTSGQSGYDGSNDAWRLTKTANQYAKLVQSISNSNLQTYSFYVKADTLDYAIIYIDASTDVAIWIDLTDGSITNTLRDDFVVSKKVEDISNGWYRCSITTNQSVSQVRIFPNDTETTYGTTNGSIYIQSAQLEQGLVSTDYIPTTTTSVTVGITDDLPRVDYSGGGCPSLLLEPSRTNLITQSEYLDAWTKSGCTIANNESTSPEGVDNASKFIASSGLSVKIAYQIISSTNSVAHTVSAFYKSDEYNYAFLRVGGQSPSPYVIYNLSNQSIVSTANATSTKIEDYGSGWYRVSMTYTANNTTNAVNVSFLPTSGYSLDSVNQPSYNGDGSSGGYVYGVQLESSASYVSSYIPTYGTSTSRSADSCSLTNASNLIGQSEGTLFWDLETTNTDLYKRLSLNDGSTTNWIFVGIELATGVCRGYVKDSGVVQVSVTGTTDLTGDRIKLALAYANNDFILYANGSQVATDTSGTVPSCNRIDVGSQNPASDVNAQSTTKQAILFPTRLTNDQLAELTK